jgi:hypothetical protein
MLMRVVLDTLCDKVCQWLVAGRLFSPDTPISSTNRTAHDRHDITEILLTLALNTITLIFGFTSSNYTYGIFKLFYRIKWECANGLLLGISCLSRVLLSICYKKKD